MRITRRNPLENIEQIKYLKSVALYPHFYANPSGVRIDVGFYFFHKVYDTFKSSYSYEPRYAGDTCSFSTT